MTGKISNLDKYFPVQIQNFSSQHTNMKTGEFRFDFKWNSFLQRDTNDFKIQKHIHCDTAHMQFRLLRSVGVFSHLH